MMRQEICEAQTTVQGESAATLAALRAAEMALSRLEGATSTIKDLRFQDPHYESMRQQAAQALDGCTQRLRNQLEGARTDVMQLVTLAANVAALDLKETTKQAPAPNASA